jgi:hypothetical protein
LLSQTDAITPIQNEDNFCKNKQPAVHANQQVESQLTVVTDENSSRDNDNNVLSSTLQSSSSTSTAASVISTLATTVTAPTSPSPATHRKYTIGMVGHPNAGKSSLINAILGRPAVSVSKTPGHTKHLQTIPLTEDLQLCDCPGLVFPAVDMPRPLQVLMGIFPPTQLREPYSCVTYLAERLNLPVIYNLSREFEENSRSGGINSADQKKVSAAKGGRKALSSRDEVDLFDILDEEVAKEALAKKKEDFAWSSWTICESLAARKGYRLPGVGGRPDTFKAGLDIVNDCLEGRLTFFFEPPGSEGDEYDLKVRKRAEQKANALKNEFKTDKYSDNDEDIEDRNKTSKQQAKKKKKKMQFNTNRSNLSSYRNKDAAPKKNKSKDTLEYA